MADFEFLHGRFCIPFPGDDHAEFSHVLSKYEAFVHDVYLGHRLFPQHHSYIDDTAVEQWLVMNNGHVPVYFTMNAIFNDFDDTKAEQLVHETDVLSFLRLHKFSGVIVAEPALARVVHRHLPDLKIHTSVNAVYASSTGDFPAVDAAQLPRGVFLPPDGMTNAKVMLNEACFRGCTGAHTRDHIMRFIQANCERHDPSEFHDDEYHDATDLSLVVCTNLCLPRWVPRVAKHAKLLKIAGRPSTNRWLDGCLHAYTTCADDVTLDTVCAFLCQYQPVHLPLSVYDDRMINCKGWEHCNPATCPIRAEVLRRVKTWAKAFAFKQF